MSVAKPPLRGYPNQPNSPQGPVVNPLLALATSLGSAAFIGILTDWATAVTVLVAVIGLFTAYWSHHRGTGS